MGRDGSLLIGHTLAHGSIGQNDIRHPILALVGMFLPVKNAGMNPFRLVFVIVAGCCLLRPAPLPAEDTPPPFAFAKQYSADVVNTNKKGHTIESKMYVDSGKLRSDANANGMSMSLIVRPDLKKIYSVMVAQKMVMQIPIDPEKYKKAMGPFGPEGKFEWVGSETVDGVACTKYKGTSGEGKVCFLWVDAAKQIPVKLAAEDGSYTVQWKNYKVGPQDAALFEPPADYKVMTMPAMPGGAGQ
jgi:hypothetical protein